MLNQSAQAMGLHALQARLQHFGKVGQILDDPATIRQFAGRVDWKGVDSLPDVGQALVLRLRQK